MLRRLLLGLVKGLLIGATLGAALQLGLRWPLSGLLGWLAAMGTGATAGILAGRPPWQQDAWFESVLKALGGIGFGALAYWGAGYVSGSFPFSLPEVDPHTPWREIPLVSLPAIAALFGAIVELDHNESASRTSRREPSTARRPERDATEL
ncbi:MAG: hypothetical protein NZ898_07570 [Myxococcota bacterium]|nr:hypothetical protein [Myxococcota bacterium]MDW8363041.1 hypothetical protein [Myxococcales bacterium]